MSTEEKQDGKSADILEPVSIAAFDLDARILRTLWLSLVTMLAMSIGQLLGTAFTLDANFDLGLIGLFVPENA